MSLNPEQVAANNYNPIAVLNLSGNSTTVSPGIPITFDGTQSYDPDNTNIIAYSVLPTGLYSISINSL